MQAKLGDVGSQQIWFPGATREMQNQLKNIVSL
jgi:hypothetical protein